ncbi:acid sphingomyelinase-like phosphodiesterase 3b [Pecten maximus]|uniref:acid sphingomyelinase-like phosphodiesterase 3b n=1 Tax=Pecten maximus TaxID=6579 RepID=UPI001457F009|nr:acid sphingomyelinase-like phosphodiesterase 3b [Pecten maximus]
MEVWIHHVGVCLLFMTSWDGCLADEGWFWHVTDFHYDFSYSGLDLSCNDVVTNHGKYGNYWCDSPWRLINSSVEAMKKFKLDVDFILWTGDSVLHTRDEHLSLDINDGILTNITTLLKQAFGSTRIYATFGNHDYFPDAQFPPNNNELYNRTLENWLTWISDEREKENFLKGAYYSAVTDHGIRIVALNTNLYYTSDKLTANLTDPAGQFAWLETLLTNSSVNNEKVLITGHVPPGVVDTMSKPWMYQHFNKKMNDIILKYSDVIIGLHFGHEHMDNFRLYRKSDVPVAVLFSAPSVTPWRYKIPTQTGAAHNPAIRLVHYDRQTGRQINMITYYMDLPASNALGEPQWAEEYNAIRDYAIADLSPTSINTLIDRIDVSGSPEFDKYWKWRVVNVPDELLEECNEACNANIVCQFRHVDQASYDACVLKAIGNSTCLVPSLAWVLVFALLGLASYAWTTI